MPLLTVKDISQHLQVKAKTIYQWCALGQVPHIRLNGSLRFDIGDIEAWVRESKKTPVSGYNKLTQARGPMKGGR